MWVLSSPHGDEHRRRKRTIVTLQEEQALRIHLLEYTLVLLLSPVRIRLQTANLWWADHLSAVSCACKPWVGSQGSLPDLTFALAQEVARHIRAWVAGLARQVPYAWASVTAYGSLLRQPARDATQGR